MSLKLRFFFRHPDPIYFSIEKLFSGISQRIAALHGDEFTVEERKMPFATKAKTILRNLFFTRKQQGDINHITGDVHYAILACSKKKVNILTIHDCVTLQHCPKGSLKYKVLKALFFDWPVKKADMVTVISGQTRHELLKVTGCDPAKIRVIPNFVNPALSPAEPKTRGGLPRCLFIGSTPNKNLERFIAAAEGLELELEIIGNISTEQRRLLEESKIQYRQSSGLSEAALAEKYIDCDILVFPSTYEGFGLPIVEAQAVGRPVLTSKLSPMQDVAGKGALLVDPYDPASIREGLVSLLKDEGLCRRLVEEGFKNVRQFHIDTIAEQYVALYRELLQ